MSAQFHGGHALLIGVGGNLPCTVNDVKELREILIDRQRCGYSARKVTVLAERDATADNIRAELKRLARVIQKEQQGTTVIVYFSGHGSRVESSDGNSYYLLASGCDFSSSKKLNETCVSGVEFTRLLEDIRAERFLLLLDCCHAGGINLPKTLGLKLQPEALPAEVQAFRSKRGRVIIASSRASELSWPGSPCSAFTHSLLEAFCGIGGSQQDGFVRTSDLALYTREKVVAKTNGAQHPILDFSEADNFEVAYYSGGGAAVKALPFSQFVLQEPSTGDAPQPERIKAPRRWRWALWILALFLLLNLTPFHFWDTIRDALFGLPEQEQMVKEAAEAYDKGFCDEEHCLEAIAKAKKVIDRYGASARSEESSLNGVPPPPIGHVSSSVAKQIFENGSLNSVAYSWWIAGRAYEKLGKFCDAAAAYESVAKFSHARTWDPQWWPLKGWSPYGWFWSPPDDARFRMADVVQRCNPQSGGNP